MLLYQIYLLADDFPADSDACLMRMKPIVIALASGVLKLETFSGTVVVVEPRNQFTANGVSLKASVLAMPYLHEPESTGSEHSSAGSDLGGCDRFTARTKRKGTALHTSLGNKGWLGGC